MSLEDLQNLVPEEGLDVAAIEREREPAPVEPDDEPDEPEDPEVAEVRRRIFDDPEYAAKIDAKAEERKTQAQLAGLASGAARRHLDRRELENAKAQAIESAGGRIDDDDWFDDEDEGEEDQSIPTSTAEAFWQLANSPGVSMEDLEEVAEATGYEQEMAQIATYVENQHQAAYVAQQQQAQQARDIELATPAVAAVAEFRRLGSLNPHVDPEIAEQYMRDMPLHLLTSTEEAEALALRAWQMADQIQESKNDETVGAMLLRGAIEERPGDFLDPQTGDVDPEKLVKWMEAGSAHSAGEPGPRARGRQWARGAEDAMDASAQRQRTIDQRKTAMVKRAEAQAEREEDERRGRKFSNPFQGT